MRIAIDCRYIRERPSGIGAYVKALTDRLPQLAPDARFQLWLHPRAQRPLNPGSNIDEVVVRSEANNLPTLLWPSRLADLRDVQVLHAPFNILGRGLRCPTVVTVHDLMWLLTPELCQASRWRRLGQTPFYSAGIRLALQRATRLIAISQATADSIVAVLPSAARRLHVVHHGIEAHFRPPTDPDAARAHAAKLVGSEAPFYLALGQNAPYKNHLSVLRAFAAAKLPTGTKLVFVQRLNPGGPLARESQRLGVAGRVVWLSGMSQDALLTLLQSCLALVQFSHNEGFGMPALEAMACGSPVIASDIPVLREVLGPAGVKVRLSAAALAEALTRVAADASWRDDLSALGLERARDFDWQRCAREHLEIYREAAGG